MSWGACQMDNKATLSRTGKCSEVNNMQGNKQNYTALMWLLPAMLSCIY